LSSTNILSIDAPALQVDVRRSSVFLSLIALAFVLRIYAIALYPLNGDEYFSLAEAKVVGLNWNSIFYSTLMHFWIRLGSSELWLRLPAAIFGTAAVAILFKVGEKLGGWRAGVVAGLLAATSPFSIYHSQEVRFYSFFVCASAAFLLATIHYVESPRTVRSRLLVLLTGIALFFAHFLGPLALYLQGAVTIFVAKDRRSRKLLLLVIVGLPVLACVLLFIPQLHHGLWRLYQTYGNAPSSAEPVMTSLSLNNLAKIAFAGFIFNFGYHVYPLRLILVITGVGLSGLLLLAGAVRLWRKTKWGVLPFAYLFVLTGVYVVLETAGGRLASGVSPRHVAFVWPVFLIVSAIGLSSFSKPVFQILLVVALAVNALSIWSGWQQDWTYGTGTDYRSAAAYVSRWTGTNTALLNDGRSEEAVNFYFPNDLKRVSSSPYLYDRDVNDLLDYQRLVFVTDDWEFDRRRAFDKLLLRLGDGFACVDGRVDYPLFEYVLEHKSPPFRSGYALRPENGQVLQPLSIYGLEFQDLQLPVSANFKDLPLKVIGSYALPDTDGRTELGVPLAHSMLTRRVILLTDVVDAKGLRSGEQIGELAITDSSGKILTYPLRLNSETASWDKRCESPAPCQTVFQWHKRLAIVGQNGYPGALRDFQAGLHGVAFELPTTMEVIRLNIRYTAGAGRLFVWAIALPN
jgi:hypothetical protein